MPRSLRYDPEDKQIVILDIFNYRNGVSLRPTGYMPSFIDSLVEKDLLDVEFLYGRDEAGARQAWVARFSVRWVAC